MKSYAQLLATPLSSLDFSPACLHWFRDAGVRTVEDVEDDITLLMRSSHCTPELLHELTTVIDDYIRSERQKHVEEKLDTIKANNGIIAKLIARLRKI